MTVGASKVICACGNTMKRTGGVFGEIVQEAHFCDNCRKHVVVVTPKQEKQEEFAERLAR